MSEHQTRAGGDATKHEPAHLEADQAKAEATKSAMAARRLHEGSGKLPAFISNLDKVLHGKGRK